MPVLATANGTLARTLRRQGGAAGGNLLRTIPTIQRRTVASLRAAARRGQPITPQLAVRAFAANARRTLGNRPVVARAITRNIALRQKVAPPHRGARAPATASNGAAPAVRELHGPGAPPGLTETRDDRRRPGARRRAAPARRSGGARGRRERRATARPLGRHPGAQPRPPRALAAPVPQGRVRQPARGAQRSARRRREPLRRALPARSGRAHALGRGGRGGGPARTEPRPAAGAARAQGSRRKPRPLRRGPVGFLLRPVRAAALGVRRAAARGRPDRRELLRGPLRRDGDRQADAGAAALQLRRLGVQPRDLPARRADRAAAQAPQPVSARHAAAAPARERLGDVERAARGLAQLAGRPRPVGRRFPSASSPASPARRSCPSRSPASGRAGTRRRRPTCWRCCSAARPRSSR